MSRQKQSIQKQSVKGALKSSTRKPTGKLMVVVGQSFPEGIDVRVSEVKDHDSDNSQSLKNVALIALCITFAGLLIAFTIYAMAMNSTAMLDHILKRIVEPGLGAIFLWACGRALLKVLSGWKDSTSP